MESKGISRANQNRKIRQEELRERLSAGGHAEHVIEMANKLADLKVKLESSDANRLRMAIDAKMKIVDKYLPSLKSQEHTGEGGEAIKHVINVSFE